MELCPLCDKYITPDNDYCSHCKVHWVGVWYV